VYILNIYSYIYHVNFAWHMLLTPPFLLPSVQNIVSLIGLFCKRDLSYVTFSTSLVTQCVIIHRLFCRALLYVLRKHLCVICVERVDMECFLMGRQTDKQSTCDIQTYTVTYVDMECFLYDYYGMLSVWLLVPAIYKHTLLRKWTWNAFCMTTMECFLYDY